jgi:hypothetical protein
MWYLAWKAAWRRRPAGVFLMRELAWAMSRSSPSQRQLSLRLSHDIAELKPAGGTPAPQKAAALCSDFQVEFYASGSVHRPGH